jgi:D-beta-D-heptose 7-phosphate kinase / D-beta-D-heptose 1-phosphate adenosyltransferase
MNAGHVLIYGDLMLDVLVTGNCRRMSPESAASPVLLMENVAVSAGGAANVAANVASMGGRALLVGAIGEDPSGAILAQALLGAGVESELLARKDPTTTKVRFVDSGQQMMRLDVERVAALDSDDEEGMIARLMDRLPKVNAVVISDYAKGAVTPKVAAKLIVAAAALGVVTVVDTKSPAASHWRGAAVVKPNLPEIASALGCAEPQTDGDAAACAQALRRRCGATFVVLTRGARGICLMGDPGGWHVAGHAVEAVDVTGAGDAVAAGLALALAGGESIIDAVRFANAAGAAAVTKMGTAALTFDEINFFYDCDARRPCRTGEGMAGERPSHSLH